MSKVAITICLFILYLLYTSVVYTKGTENKIKPSAGEQALISKGKQLYQNYNCQSCHQVYGLGGYLGPELTKAYSDPLRGEAYLRAMMINGGERMPVFHFQQQQLDAIIAYLKYVDATAPTYPPGHW